MKNFELFNGDCLDIIESIENNSIDMILCDLPYGTSASDWDKMIPIGILSESN